MLKSKSVRGSKRGWGTRWSRNRLSEGEEPLVSDGTSLALEGSPSLGSSRSQQRVPPSERHEADFSDEEWNRRVLVVLSEFLRAPGMDSLSVTELLAKWRRGEAGRRWRSAQWRGQFEQQVELSVQLHFPALPPEASTEQPHAYLRQVQEVLQRELLRLAPVLKEAGLLGTVIDRYHVHTVSQLELLLQKNLNANQMFCLLDWTLHTYLSVSKLGDAELSADVQAGRDLLPLTMWLQKAKEQLLSATQVYVAGCLQRILQMEEEEAESCDYSDEEAFVRLPLDITQCLKGVSQKATAVSPSLLREIQRICLSELHTALHRLTAQERKRMRVGLGFREQGVLHLFRTVNTCQELRLLAERLASEAQTDAAAAAVVLLEELQAQATQQLVDTVTHNAQGCLGSYFKGESTHLQELLTEMKSLLKNLPKECCTHKIVMDAVYSQIVSLYLQQLLLSNRKHLEKRWGEVGGAIRDDAEELQKVFSQQNADVEKQSLLLFKVAEVVSCEDTEALKVTCLQLNTEFPDVSKKQLNKLLTWRGGLSRHQVKAVLEMSMTPLPDRRPPTCCFCWCG